MYTSVLPSAVNHVFKQQIRRGTLLTLVIGRFSSVSLQSAAQINVDESAKQVHPRWKMLKTDFGHAVSCPHGLSSFYQVVTLKLI